MKNILYLIISLFISFSLISCEKEEYIGDGDTDNNYIKVYNKSLTGYSSELAYTVIPDENNYKVYNRSLTGYSSELAYTIVPDGDNYKVYNKYLTGYSSELAYTIVFPK